MEQLEPRMGAAAQKLQALLSEGLVEALREGNASARAHCLQALSAVGDATSAEQVPSSASFPCLPHSYDGGACISISIGVHPS